MTTNNHPAHGPVSLDRLHQIREILSKAAAQSDGGNLGYAMADAVKVIDGAIAAFGAEPVAWKWRLTSLYDSAQIGPWRVCLAPLSPGKGAGCETESIPLYAAPPAPVLPEIDRRAIADKVYGKCCRIPGATFYNAAEFAIDEVEACRAAMLQAEPQNEPQNIPENIPGGLVESVNNLLNNDGSRGCYDAMECGAAREKIELWLAQRQRWEGQRKENLSTGNYPASPDGWIPVSERMPNHKSELRVCVYTPTPHEDMRFRFVPASLFKAVCRDATHWKYMHQPAAPQQEVKNV